MAFAGVPASGDTLDGATLSGNVSVPQGTTATVYNNLTLDDALVEVRGLLDFWGTNLIDGTGRIELRATGDIRYKRDSSSYLIPGHQLTIGSGVEVVGLRDGGSGSPSISFSSSNTFNPDRLINNGTLAAEGDPADVNTDLLVSPLLFENHGLVTARDGGRMRLFMRDGWQNLGTYRAEDGGNFTLAGTIDPDALGTMETQGTGRFQLNATIENAGKTFTLDATTGSMQLIYDTTINGGRIVGLDGSKLFSTLSGQKLWDLELNGGVVLDADLEVRSYSSGVTIRDGLTLNSHFVFAGGQLTIEGPGGGTGSTLAGTGVLDLSQRLKFSGPLAIAPGLTLRGDYAATVASSTDDTLTNLGRIEALGGDLLAIQSVLAQQGEIQAIGGGKINLVGDTQNTGNILAQDYGLVRFYQGSQAGSVNVTGGGLFQFYGGTNTSTGVVTATDNGVVQISTTLQNDGTIEINGGFLWLDGGQIIGNDAVVTNSTVVLSDDLNIAALPSIPRTSSGWGLYEATLDNTGNTLTLTADRDTHWTLFGGGSKITGGVIESGDGTPLNVVLFRNNSPSVNNLSNTLDGVDVRTSVVIGKDTELYATHGTTLSGDIVFDGGGLLVLDQPMAFADLPDMTGQGGTLRPIELLDLGGATWVLPAAINYLELGQWSQGGTVPVAGLANGRIEGSPTQRLTVPTRHGNLFPLLRDLTLAMDVDLAAVYQILQIEGDVTLDGAHIQIMSGSPDGTSTVGALIRHGELRVSDGGRLLGQGELRFVPLNEGGAGFGGFTSVDDELVVADGITVIGGDGRGLIGTDTGPTRNRGTLRAEARPDGLSALRIAGTGLENTGVIEVEAGGWVEVLGDATLGGELVLDYGDATGLAEGDVLEVLGAASVIGVFDGLTMELPAAFDGSGLGVALIYDAASVSARVSLLGDLNGDGFVGIADLSAVLSAWNQEVAASAWLGGDLTGDGFVGIADLNMVLGNWNAGVPPVTGSASVPEPSALVLLGVSGAGVLSRERRER